MCMCVMCVCVMCVVRGGSYPRCKARHCTLSCAGSGRTTGHLGGVCVWRMCVCVCACVRVFVCLCHQWHPSSSLSLSLSCRQDTTHTHTPSPGETIVAVPLTDDAVCVNLYFFGAGMTKSALSASAEGSLRFVDGDDDYTWTQASKCL